MEPKKQKKGSNTADQESIDLLHMSKRPSGPGRQSYRPLTPSTSTEPLHRSPLDYVRAPGVLPNMDMSANPTPAYRSPYVTGHPAGRANWTGRSLYHGPNFSSSSNLGQAIHQASNPNMLSGEVTGSREGSQIIELGNPERAVLNQIAPWNSSHAERPAELQDSKTQAELYLERLRAFPRLQTYYEYTGGVLPNRHPRETGVCSNMDFKKTKTFIDAHGATFTGLPSGPYRYMKPENRGQELAIICATYQTISDFELYIGSSPRQKLQTWQSYEFQYRQLQNELIERWIGPPELLPKLR